MSSEVLTTEPEWRTAINAALRAKKFHDVHVHVMPLCMGNNFALFGLPEAGAYHYLQGEAGAKARMDRATQLRYGRKPALDRARNNLETILRGGALPISTAAKGFFQMAGALGLDCSQTPQRILREWESRFGGMPAREYHDMILERSVVRSMVSTQSIFVPAETTLYVDPTVMAAWDNRYEVGIRFDEALRNPQALARSAEIAGHPRAGYDWAIPSSRAELIEMTDRFIDRFRKQTKVRYLSLSLGREDRFYDRNGLAPSTERFAVMMREVVLPLAKKHKLPIFLMPYVRRGVNPSAGASGDCVASGEFDDLVRFVSENADVNFILTSLHPSLDYNGCFLSRCCPNVRLCGFWWGNLNSNEVQRQIQQRFEFIGTAWFGLNSDARILDQLLYKWPDYFHDLTEVLVQKFLPRLSGVAPITKGSIRATIAAIHDAKDLFAA